MRRTGVETAFLRIRTGPPSGPRVSGDTTTDTNTNQRPQNTTPKPMHEAQGGRPGPGLVRGGGGGPGLAGQGAHVTCLPGALRAREWDMGPAGRGRGSDARPPRSAPPNPPTHQTRTLGRGEMGTAGEREKNGGGGLGADGETWGTAPGMWVVEGCGRMWLRKMGRNWERNGRKWDEQGRKMGRNTHFPHFPGG